MCFKGTCGVQMFTCEQKMHGNGGQTLVIVFHFAHSYQLLVTGIRKPVTIPTLNYSPDWQPLL
jgi:hypothetical protein